MTIGDRIDEIQEHLSAILNELPAGSEAIGQVRDLQDAVAWATMWLLPEDDE